MKLLLPILILFVFSEIAPRAGAQDHSNQPAKRDTAYDEIAQAPAKARAKRNPLESDPEAIAAGRALFEQDRKSTRLNSSHGYISYAVFCLKKKKQDSTLDCV